MKPYYQDEHVTLYHGDSLQALACMDPAIADAVVTDPPYSSGGMVRGDRMLSTREKYVQTDSGSTVANFTGDNRDQRAYLIWSHLWISEALRVSKPGAIVGAFTDWRQLPVVTDALQVGGVVWRGIVPWHKPNGRRTQGRLANNCEYFAWGTNGPRPAAVEGASTLDGFWQENAPRERVHQTQKPLGLMRWLVQVAPPGGVVLDPFAGSGSTLVAAKETGRRAVGVEISERFCEAIAQRMEDGKQALF